MEPSTTGVIVIGGGQAGLAAGYYLRRAQVPFVILDASRGPGGAWPRMWPTLRLFSPADYARLPGWPMPPWRDGFPPASHVVDYLADYEKRYELPIERPVHVRSVTAGTHRLSVDTTSGEWHARHVISATGTWTRPFWPAYPGARAYQGRQLHTVHYRTPDEFAGQHVLVVGGGNSGAQIVAELSATTRTTWATHRPPRFLPDDVDGRVLFQIATRRAIALESGQPDPGGIPGLGDIVMVPEVRAARDRGDLSPRPLFDALTRDGARWGTLETPFDAIIWCTGFRPALDHLRPLRLREHDGTITMRGTRAAREPRLHLLGYGDWTGPGSATILGVGRTARASVASIVG
ncbi:ArsO family NAD(P)H-dependent flavin-containing monooxygenase [Lolliginicoccus suaedae]|uniref:ArsO family NAD(P)H-dependent flavin-containing monooxygenase n=1 Tax=Lolliginicoccus suaedae TaxID=2605429 RepID=UPI0011EF7013|nr:ArsO family NAD(P)H-dependent flavin-containing monooxygenase [Lolliginicoccus suaedae]